jgi:hypothetical protein
MQWQRVVAGNLIAAAALAPTATKATTEATDWETLLKGKA